MIYIIGTIIVIFGVGLSAYAMTESIIIGEKSIGLRAYFGGILMMGGLWFLFDHGCFQTIDTDRNKVILQISYKGDIPVDTTIVYK